MTFAEKTSVPVERSRAEIEGLLVKYGASCFASGWKPGAAVIQFTIKRPGGDRLVRFELPLPSGTDKAVTHFKNRYGSWTARPASSAADALAQETRRRWRALALVIKAKLEAVETGIVLFDDEFLAHFVMPNGQTLGKHLAPQLEAAYRSGEMPVLALPAGGGE
jgi:hypothetical protein